jgi:hypothetical protein
MMSILDGFGAVGLQIHAITILGSCGRPASGICLMHSASNGDVTAPGASRHRNLREPDPREVVRLLEKNLGGDSR